MTDQIKSSSINAKPKHYDIFLSHNSENKDWVRTLAQNLKANNYKVFLDEWELKGGQKFVPKLFEAIKDSRMGIIVVSPEAFESGWVKEEYEQMLIQEKDNQHFTIIPVLYGSHVPDFPFLKTRHCVDFRDPSAYRKAFYQLMCAIENKSPGPDIHLTIEPEIPDFQNDGSSSQLKDGEKAFLNDFFEMFLTKKAVLLFSQADRLKGILKQSIIGHAKTLFGETNVCEMIPPYSPDADLKDYFTRIGEDCQFSDPVSNAVDFSNAFGGRLQSQGRQFMMITGFEHSNELGQKALAAELRILNERFPETFYLLVCGGEKLADLYYTGTLSFLNQAEAYDLPELTINDVFLLMEEQKCACRVSNQTAQDMLNHSGSHPRLITQCFEFLDAEGHFHHEKYIEAQQMKPFIWQLFTPFIRDSRNKDRLCELLKQDIVTHFTPYLYDPLIKSLYWKNLIKKDSSGKNLVWRCELLKSVGRNIMAG
jgi:hypothetical protein